MAAMLKFVYKYYLNSSLFTTLTNFKLISVDKKPGILNQSFSESFL